MDRRTLLRGAAIATPLAAVGGYAAAQAAADTADFRVMVTEQVSNRVMIFNKNAAFSDANVYKTFSPGTGGWYNLSDCRATPRRSAPSGSSPPPAARSGSTTSPPS